MKQTKPSLSMLFQSKVRAWTAASFVVAVLFSFLILYWISMRESEKRAQEIAQTTAEAFRSAILSGDILGAETQAKKSFQLSETEDIVILDAELNPMISGRIWSKTASCPRIDELCTDFFSKKISLAVPIYFDNTKTNIHGYVFASVRERINWSYMISITAAVLAALLILSLGLIASMSSAFGTISNDLTLWAEKLKNDPKKLSFSGGAPFRELDPIQLALSNLRTEIIRLEKEARSEGKLMVLRGIAHDVMTPVSQLKKMLGVFKIQIKNEGKPTDEAIFKFDQYLKKIERIAAQVLVLKENQIGRDTQEEITNLFEATNAIACDLREEEVFQTGKLTLEVQGFSDRTAKVSKLDLERVLSNLIRNAAFASNEGQKILVSVSDSEGVTDILIKDFGAGILPENQESIFEVDFSTRPSVGTGLGLPIVKAICDKYGAKVLFSSTVNQGTEFRVSIPSTRGFSYEVQNSACR